MELTWKKRETKVQSMKMPNPNTHVPLIVRPLKLPRHTYTQVSLQLYKSEIGNLVWCYVFSKKKRIATLKRNFDIDLPPTG